MKVGDKVRHIRCSISHCSYLNKIGVIKEIGWGSAVVYFEGKPGRAHMNVETLELVEENIQLELF